MNQAAAWTPEEDEKLVKAVKIYGTNWTLVSDVLTAAQKYGKWVLILFFFFFFLAKTRIIDLPCSGRLEATQPPRVLVPIRGPRSPRKNQLFRHQGRGVH